MLPSLLLSLREGLEAALIIGIVISVLNRFDRNDLKPVVWQGTAAAVAHVSRMKPQKQLGLVNRPCSPWLLWLLFGKVWNWQSSYSRPHL